MQCCKYSERGHIVKYCEDLAEAHAELKQERSKGQGQQSLIYHRSLMATTKSQGKPLEQWKITS
jgi:hypothetical protein